ncbi:MAG: YifB family Mg chelatase-like AAA ATPase [Spirochaetota bacterium]
MTIYSYAPAGYHGHIVTVEVDCRVGIPGMDIVGLPASEVREARDRARVAIRNSALTFPAQRILVNLSPADVPKAGNGFDLAIAAAILASSGQLDPLGPTGVMMVGELHLDGAVGPVRGVIAAVAEGVDEGIGAFIVPRENASEARAVSQGRSIGVGHLVDLKDAVRRLGSGTANLSIDPGQPAVARPPARVSHPPATSGLLTDYAELRGLGDLKRVIEIAAAGGHHMIVVGPPGAGKSAAAGLLPTILPPLSHREAVEVTRIHSLASERGGSAGLAVDRPFRAPHHNTSTEGLLGGRLPQIPGEVPLAHCGTLFLDEALEFRRPVLQGLREPLERRRVRVARARGNYWFPARIQLVLATNLCPCGMLGRADRICMCSIAEVERYWRRLGGPLLDRIDLRAQVEPLPLERLPHTDSSASMARRVAAAIRFRDDARCQRQRNGDLTAVQAVEEARMTAAARTAFERAGRALGFSTRASLSALRIARTIADLAAAMRVDEEHVLEAVSYRRTGEVRPLWQPEL